MKNPRVYECAICGERKNGSQPWFLIADNRWQDKLRILQWHERMAAQPGIYHACTAEHVQELVVHWMTTGSLDYPFAMDPSRGPGGDGNRAPVICRQTPEDREIDTLGVDPIGELSVHRESMQRVLGEHPQSLTGILEALLSVLRHPYAARKPEAESRDELLVAQ